MTLTNQPETRTCTFRPVMAPTIQVTSVQSGAHSAGGGSAGRFTTSPWEGTYWEAAPSTDESCNESRTVEGFWDASL
jgi:hypothetical protein